MAQDHARIKYIECLAAQDHSNKNKFELLILDPLRNFQEMRLWNHPLPG